HQVQPAGRTGRQARLKGGDQRDQKGGGRRRSGPLLSRPANRPRPSRPSGGGSALSGRRSNLVMAAALLAVAVVAAALVSRLPGDQQTNEAAAAAPIGAPYSSRWICPVVPDANGSITVANSGKEPAQVRATLST